MPWENVIPGGGISSGWWPTITGGSPGSEGERNWLSGTGPSLTSTPNLSPEQMALLNQLLAGLTGGGQFDIGGAYGGDLTAEQTKLQGLSLAALEQMAMNAASPESAGATSTKALTDIINAKPQDLTSYFEKAIYAPAMQQFQNEVLPAITQRFGGLSGFGSDRMTMEAQAAGSAATGVGAKVAEAVQAQEKNRLAAALGLPGVQSSRIADLMALQQAGGVAREEAQKPLTAQYAEFQRQQSARQKNIEDILAALGIKTTTPVVMPGTPAMGGFLSGGGGGAVAGGLMSMMSDRRLKTNILCIGRHKLGIGIYFFKYIWGQPAIGVMADEVETVLPAAVIILPSGFKAVNYSMLAAA